MGIGLTAPGWLTLRLHLPSLHLVWSLQLARHMGKEACPMVLVSHRSEELLVFLKFRAWCIFGQNQNCNVIIMIKSVRLGNVCQIQWSCAPFYLLVRIPIGEFCRPLFPYDQWVPLGFWTKVRRRTLRCRCLVGIARCLRLSFCSLPVGRRRRGRWLASLQSRASR